MIKSGFIPIQVTGELAGRKDQKITVSIGEIGFSRNKRACLVLFKNLAENSDAEIVRRQADKFKVGYWSLSMNNQKEFISSPVNPQDFLSSEDTQKEDLGKMGLFLE